MSKPRTRAWRGIVAASAVAIAGIGGAVPAQAAEPREWVHCLFAGTGTMSPGMTLATQEISFTSTFVLKNCHSSDPTVTGGTGRTVGTLKGSCLAAQGTATQWITWSNGRESRAVGGFLNLGAEAVTEQVVEGEFAGTPGWNVNVVTGPASVPLGCVTGLSTVQFGGYISFGR